jgi:hypothetical protein
MQYSTLCRHYIMNITTLHLKSQALCLYCSTLIEIQAFLISWSSAFKFTFLDEYGFDIQIERTSDRIDSELT